MPDQVYNDWIRQVRDATDIIQVVGDVVPLTRRGRQYWGLCPFHNEKTPSFHVDPEKQLFYCFGCHEGGNVFNFLERLQGRPFQEVVRDLSERAGIPVPRGDNPDWERRRRRQERLLTVLAWAARFFQESLLAPAGEPGRRALAARGLDPARARERYGIGFAPDGFQALVRFLAERGVSEDEMVAAGVATARRDGGVVDRWRARVMFPIADAQGRVVGFGGRAVGAEQEPKYLNSGENELFHKGKILYGLSWARPAWRQGRRPLLVEGYFDVVACHEAGVVSAVGGLGTALTVQQARLLAREAEAVDLCLDTDAAGAAAAERAFALLAGQGVRVGHVELTAAKDPDEYRQRFGDAALAAAAAQPIPFVSWAIRQAARRPALDAAEKGRTVQRLTGLVRQVADPVERSLYLEEMARLFHLDLSILAHSVGGGQEEGRHTSGKIRHNMKGNRLRADARELRPPVPVQLLALLLRYPEHVPAVVQALPEWEPAQPEGEALAALVRWGREGPLGSWIDRVSRPARALLVEAAAFAVPEDSDGGARAVADCLARVRRELDWRALKSRADQAASWEEMAELWRRWQQSQHPVPPGGRDTV